VLPRVLFPKLAEHYLKLSFLIGPINFPIIIIKYNLLETVHEGRKEGREGGKKRKEGERKREKKKKDRKKRERKKRRKRERKRKKRERKKGRRKESQALVVHTCNLPVILSIWEAEIRRMGV
jgi:Flp pilus assembly protein TadB